jgi:homoserine kinase type II
MSVYTPIKRHQFDEFLRHYDLGSLVAYKGIDAGIENTNYFVTTATGEFVLTLFEQHGFDELPYFLDLMAFFAEHEVPCAHPIADKDGHFLRQLCGKPAALVQRLRGSAVDQPSIAQCYAIGRALGHLHDISLKFPYQRPNGRDLHWCNVIAERVLDKMDDEDEADLLTDELRFQSNYRNLVLPRGVIHADLFRDNALFEGDTLCGIIDFYYACNDVFIYDLAILVNDWCTLPNGLLENKLVDAIFKGFYEKRSLCQLERDTWVIFLRRAALRFWLSRLQDFYFPREGEITHVKNPEVFRNILLGHINAKMRTVVPTPLSVLKPTYH